VAWKVHEMKSPEEKTVRITSFIVAADAVPGGVPASFSPRTLRVSDALPAI
jgi:hypothetical protein